MLSIDFSTNSSVSFWTTHTQSLLPVSAQRHKHNSYRCCWIHQGHRLSLVDWLPDRRTASLPDRLTGLYDGTGRTDGTPGWTNGQTSSLSHSHTQSAVLRSLASYPLPLTNHSRPKVWTHLRTSWTVFNFTLKCNYFCGCQINHESQSSVPLCFILFLTEVEFSHFELLWMESAIFICSRTRRAESRRRKLKQKLTALRILSLICVYTCRFHTHPRVSSSMTDWRDLLLKWNSTDFSSFLNKQVWYKILDFEETACKTSECSNTPVTVQW